MNDEGGCLFYTVGIIALVLWAIFGNESFMNFFGSIIVFIFIAWPLIVPVAIAFVVISLISK